MNTRWARLTGGKSGPDYAARLAALAAQGRHMHGEADLCTTLVGAPARVLDAGCGTGRVAIRLAKLGYDCVGVDVDESMLAVARQASPTIRWLAADLGAVTGEQIGGAGFDLVVSAGNVIPLLAPGTLAATMAGLTRLLAVDGVLVTGFGLDAAHLPAGCPVTPLAEYDAAAEAAGLLLTERFATWDRQRFVRGAGYAVSVHRCAEPR